jgi:hypothetical protein
MRKHGVFGLIALEQPLVSQVDERRYVGFRECRPERIPVLVARGDAARRLGARQIDGLRAQLDHALRFGNRVVDVAGVDVTDGAATTLGPPGEVEGIVVVADAGVACGLRRGAEVVEGVVREHELGLDAHPVEGLDPLVGIIGPQRAEPFRLPELRAVLLATLLELGMLHVAVEELEVVAEGELGEDLPEYLWMDVDVSVAVQGLPREGVWRRRVRARRRAVGRHRALSPF